MNLKSRAQTRTASGSVNHRPRLTLAPWIPFQAPGFPSATPRTVFTKTALPASLDALALLGTSRRKVRILRTIPAVLSSDEGDRS
jgi:hypothetical protein